MAEPSQQSVVEQKSAGHQKNITKLNTCGNTATLVSAFFLAPLSIQVLLRNLVHFVDVIPAIPCFIESGGHPSTLILPGHRMRVLLDLAILSSRDHALWLRGSWWILHPEKA